MSARELSSRGGGQTINQARRKAMRITACILLATAACRVPYTSMVYWRNNLPDEINSVGIESVLSMEICSCSNLWFLFANSDARV